MSFESLGLSEAVLKALRACSYRAPTPIQRQAIPPALAGKDVLGCAQTGTGKTCAFGAPIVQRLLEKPTKQKKIRALILTPTRELALQIGENIEAYHKGMPLRSTVIFGGVGQAPQVDSLKKGVDILTATPGRLLDLQNQGLISLSGVEIFVLDEADRMLDMGFIHDVKKIVAFLPEQKQTLFFSATMPDEVMDLVRAFTKNPVRVEVNPVSSPVEKIHQQAYLLDRKNKTRLLISLLQDAAVKNALVFTRTKHGADKVSRELNRGGIRASAIHGNKSQTARQQALEQLKKGKIQALVATDIAARGLDIEELSHVFNYNLPEVPETYIHRIGRTGRADHGGVAISFCDFSEKPLLRSIEILLGKPIPLVKDHPWPMEEFTAPGKDAKGRIVHPDDEEARRAAKGRRSTSVKKEKTERPGAPGMSTPKGTVPQKKSDNNSIIRKEDSIAMKRQNPLDGDIIMDATARLLSAKTSERQGSAGAGLGFESGRKGRQERRDSGKQTTRKDLAEGGNRTQRRQVQRDKKPAQVEQIERMNPTPAPVGKGSRQMPYSVRDKAAGGRKRRQGAPPVQGLRSHQKDSTEQPSLMKPFYIEHD